MNALVKDFSAYTFLLMTELSLCLIYAKDVMERQALQAFGIFLKVEGKRVTRSGMDRHRQTVSEKSVGVISISC